MNNRLKQFLAAENITQAQFADNINVVRASVSHVLSGRNNPSFDFIKAMMAQYPRLNMDWLIFGKGRMYKDSSPVQDESQLFPIELEIPARIPEIDQQDIVPAPKPSSDSQNTPDDTLQASVKQRKVSKIIILYDDGTFQEM
jgi:transcriptional regulator with XRE-family HTH domain